MRETKIDSVDQVLAKQTIAQLVDIFGVDELTRFPIDPYHELVGCDFSCHESVGFDRSFLFKSDTFCAYSVLPEKRTCPTSTFFCLKKSR